MLYIGRRVSTDPKSGQLLKLFIIYIKRGDKKNHILINNRELPINLLLFFPKRSVSVLLIKKFKLILVSYVVVQRSSPLHYLGREVREKQKKLHSFAIYRIPIPFQKQQRVLKSESSLFLQENKSAILFQIHFYYLST